MAQLGGYKMESPYLREINYKHKAIKGKKYVDSNGSVYIGQPDGRLLLESIEANVYTKDEVDALINSLQIPIVTSTSISSLETDPIWNTDKPSYSTKLFTLAMSIALG